MYSGQSAESRGCASVNGFVSAVEIVPGEGVHSWAQDNIRTALPGFGVMLLRGSDGAAYDLKYVCGRSGVSVMNADGHAHYKVSAKLSGYAHGNGLHQATVGQAARSNFDGLKESRKGTARPKRVDQVSLSKHDRLAGGEIRGNYGGGNLQILELTGVENALDEVAETIIAGKPEPRNTPTRDIAKAKRTASGDDSRERRATGICGSENAADASPYNERNGNLILLERLQDAKMGKTSGKSSA